MGIQTAEYVSEFPKVSRASAVGSHLNLDLGDRNAQASNVDHSIKSRLYLRIIRTSPVKVIQIDCIKIMIGLKRAQPIKTSRLRLSLKEPKHQSTPSDVAQVARRLSSKSPDHDMRSSFFAPTGAWLRENAGFQATEVRPRGRLGLWSVSRFYPVALVLGPNRFCARKLIYLAPRCMNVADGSIRPFAAPSAKVSFCRRASESAPARRSETDLTPPPSPPASAIPPPPRPVWPDVRPDPRWPSGISPARC